LFDGKKVTVVIPAYNEEGSIAKVISDFKSLNLIDEVIVVSNNSTDNTRELAKASGAKVLNEPRQGYGFALQRGLMDASGDIIILTEADDSFYATDIHKLLAYIRDVDLVLGTRTTKELLHEGAKMDWFLLYGNIFLAKLIQFCFWGRCRLTDVGCTFRAITRVALKRFLDNLYIGGPHFSPHMIIEAIKVGTSIVEIPVNYKARVGESKITTNRKKSFMVGLRMLKIIFDAYIWRVRMLS